MKYFSELTKEVYDTPEALQEAELAYITIPESNSDKLDDSVKDVEKIYTDLEELDINDSSEKASCEAIPQAEVSELQEVKPTKKQLASNVEIAENNLQEANAKLAIAEQEVERLSQEYLKLVDEILRPAKEAVADAQRAKYDAISKFNEEYGAYQVLYTGTRAADEMLRAINEMNARTARIFKHFWL